MSASLLRTSLSLKAYPDEALEFLAEDAVQLHGKPISWEFLDTAVGKEDVAEPGPGQAMDLAIRYRFGDGTATILVLMKRFPGETILPIALVDDDRPRDLQGTVEHKALDFSPFRFTTRIVQVPALSMERFRHTANRVALSFTPNMAGANRLEQVLRVTVTFQEQGDTMGVRKFFAFWVVEGRLELEEQREVKRKLEEMAMPEIMEWFKQEGIEEGIERGMERGMERGIEQGLRLKALEDARKMLDRGCDWAFVTDITGLKPEDLEAV